MEHGERAVSNSLTELFSPSLLSLLVEPLFLALSHCASLHPSTVDGDEDGNPFASMGPFGTGANGNGEGLQFEDAEEEGGAELSDTGRVRTDFQTPDARYRPY